MEEALRKGLRERYEEGPSSLVRRVRHTGVYRWYLGDCTVVNQ